MANVNAVRKLIQDAFQTTSKGARQVAGEAFDRQSFRKDFFDVDSANSQSFRNNIIEGIQNSGETFDSNQLKRHLENSLEQMHPNEDPRRLSEIAQNHVDTIDTQLTDPSVAKATRQEPTVGNIDNLGDATDPSLAQKTDDAPNNVQPQQPQQIPYAQPTSIKGAVAQVATEKTIGFLSRHSSAVTTFLRRSAYSVLGYAAITGTLTATDAVIEDPDPGQIGPLEATANFAQGFGFAAMRGVNPFDGGGWHQIISDLKVGWAEGNPDFKAKLARDFVDPRTNETVFEGQNERAMAVMLNLKEDAELVSIQSEAATFLLNNSNTRGIFSDTISYRDELFERSTLSGTDPKALKPYEMNALNTYLEPALEGNEGAKNLSAIGKIEFIKMNAGTPEAEAYYKEVETKIKNGTHVTSYQQNAYAVQSTIRANTQKQIADLKTQSIDEAAKDYRASGTGFDLSGKALPNLPQFPVGINAVFTELNTWGQGSPQNQLAVQNAWNNASTDGNNTIDNAQEWKNFRNGINDPQINLALNLVK